jgi:hypothetical protein
MESFNIIDAAVNGDEEAFVNAFNAAMAPKISDALEVKKVEIASTLLTPEESNDEVPEHEAEVDGSTNDDESADASDNNATEA